MFTHLVIVLTQPTNTFTHFCFLLKKDDSRFTVLIKNRKHNEELRT